MWDKSRDVEPPYDTVEARLTIVAGRRGLDPRAVTIRGVEFVYRRPQGACWYDVLQGEEIGREIGWSRYGNAMVCASLSPVCGTKSETRSRRRQLELRNFHHPQRGGLVKGFRGRR